MKIGIDISMLVYQGSGVANYTYNMVKNLLINDKKNEYRLFYSSLRRPKNFYYLDEFRKLGGKIYDFPFPPWLLKIWWNKYHIIPVEWFIGKVDFYFSSDFLRPPLMKGTKGITTIHDLTWKLFPQYHTIDIVDAHSNKLAKTIKYNDIIIVDSLNTKNDLISNYPTIQNTNIISLVYPGINDHFKPINDKKAIKQVLNKYGVHYPANYLLYVGAIEPRKNLITTISVFDELIKNRNYSDYRFLIVGRAGWKNEKIFGHIRKLRLEHKVIFVGLVKDNDLPFFYNGCAVNMYLSNYEGFGLPPIEAAACNKLTLLYNHSSLKELFDNKYPYATENKEISTLIKLLELKNINPYIIKDKFSWESFTVRFLKIINNNH